MPALQSYFIEPISEQVCALLLVEEVNPLRADAAP
jgi:hypothetical protein